MYVIYLCVRTRDYVCLCVHTHTQKHTYIYMYIQTYIVICAHLRPDMIFKPFNSFNVFIVSSNLGHGTVSLVRICLSFVCCYRYCWDLFQLSLHPCNFSYLYIHAISVISTSMQWAKLFLKIVFDRDYLHGGGCTGRDIAANLRCSKTVVHNAIVS